MRRASRRIIGVGAGLLLVVASLGATAGPAAAESAAKGAVEGAVLQDVGVQGCANHAHSNIDRDTGRTNAQGVRIRSGPHTTCTILGLANSGHVLDYHCFNINEQRETWTFLRDTATGVQGWVRDTLLNDFGSFVHC